VPSQTLTRPRPGRLSLSARAVFETRCEGRAILCALGEFDLHEAVDLLQADAVATGLVNEIGQDAVQAIMADAFGRIRRDEW
jgi:hypothetical protein